MGKLNPNLDFRLMSLAFRLRDFRLPRMEILEEVGIQTGFRVLDYGCGPGSYVAAASDLVGPSGKVYALDIHSAGSPGRPAPCFEKRTHQRGDYPL